MESESISLNQEKIIWMLDDLFDDRTISIMRDLLQERGYELALSSSDSYQSDYIKYAPCALAVLAQVNFRLTDADLQGFTNCKIISVMGVGYDQVDLSAATRHGIAVTHAPAFCVEEVSDHALTLLLALNRRLPVCQELTRQGRGEMLDIWSIRRLRGQILGLVGFGRIGQALARKAQGLGLQIIAYDPFLSESTMRRLNVDGVVLDTLLKSADYVSLHVPLNETTYHLINAATFEAMKETAFLINTCRGDVVDERALTDALQAQKIAGAGLDVLSQEPVDIHHPLLSMDNVIVSPHAAFVSYESMIDLAEVCTTSIVDILSGKTPEYLLNPEAVNPSRG